MSLNWVKYAKQPCRCGHLSHVDGHPIEVCISCFSKAVIKRSLKKRQDNNSTAA